MLAFDANRHGDLGPVDLPTFLGADPDLALVTADPVAWSLAHPCDCEGRCECED